MEYFLQLETEIIIIIINFDSIIYLKQFSFLRMRSK
jgi:hypothetical protein